MGALPLIATGFQAVSSFMGKSAVAKAQEAQYKQNAESAGEAAVVKSQAMNETYQRNLEVLSGQNMDVALKALKTEASQEASASEGGVGGQSINAIFRTTQADSLRQQSAIKQQADELKFNVLLESKGIDAELQNRINSVQRGQTPSLFGELASAGLGYAISRKLDPAKTGTTEIEKIKTGTTEIKKIKTGTTEIKKIKTS